MAQSLASQRFRSRRAFNFNRSGEDGPPVANPASDPANGAGQGFANQRFSATAAAAPTGGGGTNGLPGGRGSEVGGTFHNAGSVLGTIGTIASGLTGIPGLGLAGNAIGTLAEANNINAALSASNMPGLSAGQIASGAVNSGTFGGFGTSLGDSMVGNAVSGLSSSGVPGSAADDPSEYTEGQARSFAPSMSPAPSTPANAAPSLGADPDAGRSRDAQGNALLGTSAEDNSEGSQGGYGGSRAGAFGNYPTFGDFYATMFQGAPPPWAGRSPTSDEPTTEFTSNPEGTPPAAEAYTSSPENTGDLFGDGGERGGDFGGNDGGDAGETNGGERGGDFGGNDGGDAGDTGGGDTGGGDTGGNSGGGDGNGSGGSGFARGGIVTADRLKGPNPPGPDDGHAALDVGEGVLTAEAVKYYGPDVVMALNRGLVDRATLRRLFGR